MRTLTTGPPPNDAASIATSAYTCEVTNHARERCKERDVDPSLFKTMKKHGAHTRMASGHWAIVWKKYKYITDPSKKKVITCWRLRKQKCPTLAAPNPTPVRPPKTTTRPNPTPVQPQTPSQPLVPKDIKILTLRHQPTMYAPSPFHVQFLRIYDVLRAACRQWDAAAHARLIILRWHAVRWHAVVQHNKSVRARRSNANKQYHTTLRKAKQRYRMQCLRKAKQRYRMQCRWLKLTARFPSR